VHVTSVCIYVEVRKMAISDKLINGLLFVITSPKEVLLNSREFIYAEKRRKIITNEI
jgi:hypothetical protein